MTAKRLLHLQNKDYLTKTEFAKRIGVSTPTLYAWMKKDKDGISKFVSGEGISVKIFDIEPWNRFKDDADGERIRMQSQIDDLTDEADRNYDRVVELTAENENLKVRIEALQQTVNMLQSQLTIKDQQLHGMIAVLNQQALALPEPKVHWWQRRRNKAKTENVQ